MAPRITIKDEAGEGDDIRFWLEYGAHRLELRPGVLLIGRAASCQLVIEDSLVSRRHAQLTVTSKSVTLEDFGSVNGVFVNARRIEGVVQLRSGDRIVIGKQEMMLRAAPRLVAPESGRHPLGETLHGLESVHPMSRPTIISTPSQVSEESESTRQGTALELLGGVAHKVLALGRGEEAEKILGTYLLNLLDNARTTKFVEQPLAEKAAAFAVKLAHATKKGSWVDYAIELYSVLVRPLPGALVDELHTVLRNVSGINLQTLRAYVGLLKNAQQRFGPADRFLVQRIEGLERLASSR
jgi:hypothetical protein